MLEKKSKIVVVYLLWSQEPFSYLQDALEGACKQTYPKELTELLIVYNSHKPEEKSACPYIRETVEKYKDRLPSVTILEQEKNLGFSGGNNLGMKWAIDHGFDYVFLHNGDGLMHQDCLAQLVSNMDQDSKIGASQSLVMLYPETDLINTAGNCFHYLGFGYCNQYRKLITDLNKEPVQDISYASGAAVCMRADLLQKYGLWDQDFFMYHEDLEYSFRLRMAGFKTALIKDSLFFHKYQFSKSISKYFWMERNRYGVMLMFFRWPTLFLLLPLAIVLEVGLWFFAFKGGWFKEKMKVYSYWLKIQSWKLWLKKRKNVQQLRQVKDRDLMRLAQSGISFQEKAMDNVLLKYLGNPIMKVYYWAIIRGLVWW